MASEINRRDFLKGAIAGTAAGLVGLPATASTGKAGASKPNILFIMSDQHKALAMGCYGNEDVKTPVFDSMAANGIRFHNAFVQSPLCIPSRACLLTGKYPQSHGLQHKNRLLSSDEVFLADVLRDAGYWVGSVGKMHHIPPTDKRGFADLYDIPMWERGKAGMAKIHTKNVAGTPNQFIHGISGLAPENHPTAQLTNKAITQLKDRAAEPDRPFLLWVSYVPPHHPCLPPQEYADMYDPAKIALPPNFNKPRCPTSRASPKTSRARCKPRLNPLNKSAGVPLDQHSPWRATMKPVRLIVGLLAAVFLSPVALGESMETFTLKAGSVQATFRLAGKGGITSLRAGEVELVQPGWQHPTLFRITLVEGKREKAFTSLQFDEFDCEKIPSGIRFTYSGLEGAALEITATVEAKGDYLAFTSQVRCGPETVCSTLEYPYISGYESLSGNPDDDRYLYPKSSGEIHHNPSREVRRSRRGMVGLLAYPGTQGLQFHALYNQNGGIVMYAADPECNPKRFTIRHDREHDSAAWLVLHYFDETPGFAFKQDYGVRVQACGPSWFDAADVYAEWGRKQHWMNKKVDFPQWILQMPILANVHDNENWGRVLPSWIAEHQPEMNKLLGDRPLVHQFQRWEHYGQWIAPDSFPPLGGEEAMIEASKKARSWGNHLKHLFSSGQYWLHEDVTDEYFEKHVKSMAIMPRGGGSRKAIVGKHPYRFWTNSTLPSTQGSPRPFSAGNTWPNHTCHGCTSLSCEAPWLPSIRRMKTSSTFLFTTTSTATR